MHPVQQGIIHSACILTYNKLGFPVVNQGSRQMHGFFTPPNPNFHPIHLTQTTMSSQNKQVVEQRGLTKQKEKKNSSGTTKLLHVLQKPHEDQMQ